MDAVSAQRSPQRDGDVASPDPMRFTIDLGDGAVAGIRFAKPGASPLLFCHANGFCASTYRRVLARLAADFDVFALDLRGHGRSTLPADPQRFESWVVHAADIIALLDAAPSALGAAGPWRLAGHSMGAVASTLAAAGRRDIAAIRLIEPVATPRLSGLLAYTPFWPALAGATPLVAAAKRRRDRWPSRDEALASYRGKPLFGTWAAGVLEDYLFDGLVDGEGGVRLSCAPAWEAANFAAQRHDFWRAVRRAPAPVAILGANHPTSTLFLDASARLRRLGARVEILDGASHLLPMEAPDAAAAFIAAD